jgi:hypothetical protein
VSLFTSLPPYRRPRPIQQLIRALMLDRTLYEEVAVDRTGLSQAFGVVVLAGIAKGVSLTAIPGLVGALFGIFVSVVGWIVLSALTFAIGNWVLRAGPSSWRAVAACLGFADVPAVLNFLEVIPWAGPFVRVIVWFWLLAATMVAARAAFRVSFARGAAIGGFGFSAYFLIGFVVEMWSS